MAIVKRAFTDGGCYNNPPRKGIGAFAYVTPEYGNMVHIVGGRVNNATNNRTEMMAILSAIYDLCQHCDKLDIWTDSGYCVDGYTKYLDNWLINGYKTSTNNPVKNQDLWNEFAQIRWHNQFVLNLMRGHNKDNNIERSYWNNVCDYACTFLMNKVKECGIYTMSYIKTDTYHKNHKFLDISEIQRVRDLPERWRDIDVANAM